MKCSNCSQEVIPIKQVSGGAIIVALICSIFTYGGALVLYLLYYAFFKTANTCPHCSKQMF